MRSVSEKEGLEEIRKICAEGTWVCVRWRLVNHAGAVINYILNNEKMLEDLLVHIRKYKWRGCIDFTTSHPALLHFKSNECEKMIEECRKYRECSVAIQWSPDSYYEQSGYDRYTIEEDPNYFNYEDEKHYGYVVLLKDNLFDGVDFKYFYLNDDSSGGY